MAPYPNGERRLDLSQPGLSIAVGVDEPDAVIHAASCVPHAAVRDTEDRAEMTRRLDANVFRAVEYWNVPSLYISTCTLYERRGDAACDEVSPLREEFESPYLRAKLDGEKLFGQRRDVAIFRLSAPLGPGMRTGTVVPAFVEAARNQGMLTVWGDGSREQDFIDTRDTASLIAAWASSPRFGTFNMAKGEPTTMLELARAIIEVIGSGTLIRQDRADPNAGIRARYDVSKARSHFGWEPRYGLRESIAAISQLAF